LPIESSISSKTRCQGPQALHTIVGVLSKDTIATRIALVAFLVTGVGRLPVEASDDLTWSVRKIRKNETDKDGSEVTAHDC
jgi:hypothetical protein